MKRWAFITLLGLLGGGLAGCHREEAKGETEDKVSALQLFEKGRGVRLTDEMRQRFGVETVEVTEKLLTWSVEKPARVFRTADGSRPGAAVALLSETEAKELCAGQSVVLKQPIDSREGKPTMVAGTLAAMDTRTSPVLGQVEGLIEFADSERRFPSGAFLTASFTGSRTNRVSAIPSSAVVAGSDGSFVYTANGSHYMRTPVKLGAVSGDWVEVVDGLYAGDVVVAKAADTMWMIELCAIKGGSPCCPAPMKK